MNTACRHLAALISVCRRKPLCLVHEPVGEAERAGRAEGKIKADGTLWPRSAGQALVCTLLGTAPSKCLHGAGDLREASFCKPFDGTFARDPACWRDRR